MFFEKKYLFFLSTFLFILPAKADLARLDGIGCINTNGAYYLPCSSPSYTASSDFWKATCGATNSIPIEGVAYCGQSGSIGNTSNSLTAGNSCWCKIVYPFISSWAYIGALGSGACPTDCASWCATAMTSTDSSYVSFKTAISNTLSI